METFILFAVGLLILSVACLVFAVAIEYIKKTIFNPLKLKT